MVAGPEPPAVPQFRESPYVPPRTRPEKRRPGNVDGTLRGLKIAMGIATAAWLAWLAAYAVSAVRDAAALSAEYGSDFEGAFWSNFIPSVIVPSIVYGIAIVAMFVFYFVAKP
jgi:hypothetical protein